MCTSSQPGRLGGDIITPRTLSKGPPQLMPTPERSECLRPYFLRSNSELSKSVSIVGFGPTLVGNVIFSTILADPSFSTLPNMEAHLVPPISKPRIFISD